MTTATPSDGVKVLDMAEGNGWTIYHGDTVEAIKGLPDRSVHLTVTSVPFSSLFTYSNSPRDVGNCSGDGQFFAHMQFLATEMLRITKPGRIAAIHCMLLPTSKERDGHIGLRDFRGDIIRLFESAGWIFHSEVCIRKDPVTAMQRTKALGLLHKTVRSNASFSRMGIPDYLVGMRAPGEIDVDDRVRHGEEYPVTLWQRIAEPVWMDIDPGDTLQKESARAEEDERHICPLQLEVIRRAVLLWTNPGDVVFDPFGGIGSTGYVALEEGRRAVLCELKDSYFKQAALNLARAATVKHGALFS